jgi:hypothetical protein
MNRIGPSLTVKDATKLNTAIAVRIWISKSMLSARHKDEMPMLEIDSKRQVLRPRRLARGEPKMVAKRLTTDIKIVRSETEYIITLLMLQSCWANITPTTAIIAGR